MEYLLTPKNIKVVESFAAVHTVYGFDFDGTLAPIVSNPEQAFMTKKVQMSLKKLNSLVPLAIITGRSVKDVRKFLDFEPKYIIGNHGVEGTQSESELSEIEKACASLKIYLVRFFSSHLSQLGITLEDKRYSLSLHYRNSTDIQKAEDFLNFYLRDLPSASVSRGKMVFNVLPYKSVNKGQAFFNILSKESASFGFYIGDDETDETVFTQQDSRILNVRVGDSNISAANYYLKNQNEIGDLLEILINLKSRSF